MRAAVAHAAPPRSRRARRRPRAAAPAQHAAAAPGRTRPGEGSRAARRAVAAVRVLGSENKERHRSSFNNELPPRPLGVASGMPWEPREPMRDHALQSLTVRFLETIEHIPMLQPVAAALAGAIALAKGVRADDPAPSPVADPPGAWKFAALGDYGAGTDQQRRVAANILRSGAELVITAGDNVYPTGRWEDYARNFDPPDLMGVLATRIPFMPALGNHDMYRDDLRPYFGHFPHLQGRPYYAYTMRNVHFLALDGDQDLRKGSAQYRWLEQELASSKEPWRVVYLHYPLYGRDLNAYDEIRKAVQPLLAKYKVQLLIAGHEHNYQRSIPIDGVTHLLTGGGGQQVFPFTNHKPSHTAVRRATFHHVEVAVGATQLVVRAIDQHGRLIDTAVIPIGAVAQAKQGVAALPQVRRRGRRVAVR